MRGKQPIEPYWSHVLMGALSREESIRIYEEDIPAPYRPPEAEYMERAASARAAYGERTVPDRGSMELDPVDRQQAPVQQLVGDPRARTLFKQADAEIVWVPIDGLLVTQRSVGVGYRPAPEPGDREGALSYALLPGEPKVEPRAFREGGVVVSPEKLRPEVHEARSSAGACGDGAVGIFTTFGSAPATISATWHGDRLVLVNGHHRCLQMWQAGWDRVPLVVSDGIGWRGREQTIRSNKQRDASGSSVRPEDAVGTSRWRPRWRTLDIWRTPYAPRLIDLGNDDFSMELPLHRRHYRYEVRVQVRGGPLAVPDELYREAQGPPSWALLSEEAPEPLAPVPGGEPLG